MIENRDHPWSIIAVKTLKRSTDISPSFISFRRRRPLSDDAKKIVARPQRASCREGQLHLASLLGARFARGRPKRRPRPKISPPRWPTFSPPLTPPASTTMTSPGRPISSAFNAYSSAPRIRTAAAGGVRRRLSDTLTR
jgi:hypothetical protein